MRYKRAPTLARASRHTDNLSTLNSQLSAMIVVIKPNTPRDADR